MAAHGTLGAQFPCASAHATGADWLALLCTHIPDRFEHLVRYAGWYSNRSRGKRRRAGADPADSLYLGLWAPQQTPKSA